VEDEAQWTSRLNKPIARRRALVLTGGAALGAVVLAACGDDDDEGSTSDEGPMYAAVRSYQNVPDPAEAGRQVAETFVPLVTDISGFLAYYWIDTGGGTMVSVTVCRDKAGADESVSRAREWVQDHPDVLPPVTSVVEGNVLATAEAG
jgi:hypothetical protein